MKRAYRLLAGVAMLALTANLSAQQDEEFCTEGPDCVPDSLEVIFVVPDGENRSAYGGAEDAGTVVEAEFATETMTDKIQGWSFGVAHDDAKLTIVEDSVTIEGTIAHPDHPNAVAFPPNFDATRAVPGGFISAVVLSFLTETQLPMGFNVICKANYEIVDVSEAAFIRYVDRGVGPDGSPPTDINLTVDGATRLPARFVQGQVGGGAGAVEICDNGTDDDGDGDVDCDDTDCDGDPACPDAEICDNGTDDDGDGDVDCDDADCDGDPACPDAEICDNEVDDDGDGDIDCDDADCDGDPACPDEPAEEICDNQMDDDEDGDVDCDDADCVGDPACPAAECPDYGFFFGPAGTDAAYDAGGDATMVITQRNASDAYAMSLGATVEESGGSFNYTFSGDLGADANRLIELIITGENGETFTPVAGNTATADRAPVNISRGAQTTPFDGDDFFAFELEPGVGGPGFTIGYVADLAGGDNKLPPTGGDCQVHEVFVIEFTGEVLKRFQRGDADGNGKVNVSDAVWIIQIVVGNFTEVYDCDDALDTNDDGSVNVADALPVLSWLFQRGPRLPEPFLACGTDAGGNCAEDSPACP